MVLYKNRHFQHEPVKSYLEMEKGRHGIHKTKKKKELPSLGLKNSDKRSIIPVAEANFGFKE